MRKKDAFRIIGVGESLHHEIEKNFEIVPAAEWAVFGGEGIGQSIQELERKIVTEWLPTSGYEYGDAPEQLRGVKIKIRAGFLYKKGTCFLAFF